MNPSTAAAQVILDELIRSEVNDVVLSPGSRNSPLAIEAARAHERGEIRLHVRIDERSAGFLALGLAKRSGMPVPVITTSGTAVANLVPAVEEAFHSCVPLVVLTADRPAELRLTGANQTIDQVRILDGIVKWSADLEAASQRPGQVGYWRSSVSRACAVATDSLHAGPVHINVGFREPLVPDDDEFWPESLAGHDGLSFVDSDGDEFQVVRTWTVDRRLFLRVQEPIDELLDDLAVGELPQRGLVIVGDVADPEDAAAAVELAEACGWPLHSEPSGQARAGSVALAHASLLTASPAFRASHQPDLVLTVGKFGLSRGLVELTREAGVHIHAEPQRSLDWPDPTRTAIAVLGSVPAPPAQTEVPESSEWLDGWLMADAAAQRVVEKVLNGSSGPTGLHVASALWNVAGPDDLLFVASSRSVRDLEATAPVRPDQPLILANRGVNGIDGLVSTAVGAALAHQSAGGGQAFAMLGDLALLHDSNGLAIGPQESVPDLCLVIVDNDGGGIFGSLEPANPSLSDVFERVFATPVGTQIRDLLKAHGVWVHEGPDWQAALATCRSREGLQAIVVPGDRAREAQLYRQILEQLG